jgi:hypothetical protein
MTEFYCRGEESRKRLIEKYEIIPYSHRKLLNGQIKHSAAKDMITKEYYCFIYKEKNTSNKEDTFIVGTYVAKHFLELLKLDPLPLFNMLKSDGDKKRAESEKEIYIQEKEWNPLALELYNIINIIQTVWDTNGSVLAEILINVIKNKNKEPSLKYLKSVNTIISKDSKKRNIKNMLDCIRENNEIKEYDFPFVEKVLVENGIKNYITGNDT